MARTELGDFLRARRQALRPADVGLAPGGRRRTPGLRREEVALLANLSVDYYERLEQSRSANPSEALLGSLARALRLSVDERDYLYRLAGYPPPTSGTAGGYVDPAMMFLLDALTTVPAHVIDDQSTILAQNALSRALLGTWTGNEGRNANVAWRWFTDPDSRALNVPDEHEAIGRGYVADLRAAAARRGRDPVFEQLVADLGTASAEFARYWAEMQVAPLQTTRKVLVHPRAGRLDVQCDFVLSTTTGQRLVIFRPQPGSTTADSFDFLRVLGEQSFDDRR
ncbi:helix-turn-helix transcriptional regulator [Plantactinospora soyae]|uniref:Transcriptional regulator with XRE-family HTH domain n=1 Tax=Plantactinospora soyae TaxID=1544732 RepID=A0A927ME11_9ACTN|nr:helix-turn-helix transcriptional regulator [Plantactinospora soyae]MBE1491381.1 transcriptional regulator with XRE-family HTH domain [Plantactinospora soyae]